ncbi:MAG TPA: TetR/AcrR family transcriptional regulator [Acidimicrobiales bacterium]|nr:TetR/AcrR family transcriptional regulator [Acidimicrobiales bacterium]
MTRHAIALLQERGVNGVTIDAVLAASAAPRGSVYHHFPGGRAELVHEAARASATTMTDFIRHGAQAPLQRLIDDFVDLWRQALLRSDFRAGCPIASLIAETADELRASVDLAARTFDEWIDLLRDAQIAQGCDPDEATGRSVLTVAAVEGAITLCRARRSIDPLELVAAQLHRLADIPEGR